MLWNQLLSEAETAVLPWTGGRVIHDRRRSWKVAGPLPPEHGWHRFAISGSRRASWVEPAEPVFDFDLGREVLRGYLVEDRLIPDGAAVHDEVREVFAQGHQVWLPEPGLDRFARALVARHRNGKLIYLRQEFPLGPEGEVLEAFQDRRETLDHIAGVTPALHLAFLWHRWRRHQAEEERRRLERLARHEAEHRARLERRQRYQAALNQGGRRADFEQAARDALSVAGAELLDHRKARSKTEAIVQFRFRNRRFECVVHRETLRIIDSGICLENHATGERGDRRFTLESLPVVIDEALRTGHLVIFRHVNG